MSSKFRLAALGAAVLGAAYALPAQAQGVNLGTLTCNVAGGWGFVFGSSRTIACTYFGGPGRYEHYVGQINKFGVDIGYTQRAVMVWTVVAPTINMAPGSLAGGYIGGTASVGLGVGVGANALVGGNANSITLQPLSIEGYQGINIAGGVAALTLTPAPEPGPAMPPPPPGMR